jgi:hypothetical protein
MKKPTEKRKKIVYCIRIYKVNPDEALDKHTRRGKAKGRGLLYFYKESAKLNNAKKEANEEEIEQKIVKKISNV